MPTRISNKKDSKIVTADSRGRIILGADAKAQTFTIKHTAEGDYVLTPVVHVPAREAWLSYENESRASFERGIADIKAGHVKEIDFSQFLTAEDIEEAEEAARE